MKERPSFASFIKVNYQSLSFFSNYKFLIYDNIKTGKRYKEKNALKNRIKFEIILVLIPIIVYVLFEYLSRYSLWNDIIVYTAISLIVIILLVVYPLRFLFVKFEEISNIDEAKDTRFRAFELVFLLISVISMLLVMIYIITSMAQNLIG